MANTEPSTDTIECNVRTDDLIRVGLGALLTNRVIWLVVAVAVGFFNAQQFQTLLGAKFPWPDAGYFALIIIAQVTIFVGILCLLSLLITVARPSWRAERIAQHRITATSDGLIDETNRHKREYKWLAVNKIKATDRYLLISFSGTEKLVMPRRDFASEAQFRGFARLLAARIASAQGVEANQIEPRFPVGGATPAKLTVFFVAFLTGVFVLESYVRHNMFKDYTEYAAYMNRWDESQDVEDVAIEQASWIGTTGLSEQTERKLPRVLRRALGELLIDKNSLKANELTYIGEFDEAGKSVHYWRLPIRYGKSLFAKVSLRRTGEPVIKLDNTGPTLIRI